MKTIEGLDTSSTAIVSRLRCSTDRPLTPGRPTSAPRSGVSSTTAMIWDVAGQAARNAS